MKKINNLTEYINVVENLSSIFKFNFPNGSYEDVYPDFREEDFTGEQKQSVMREQYIEDVWGKIFDIKERLYYQALRRRDSEVNFISSFYFRGVPDTAYLNAPGIYRKGLPAGKSEHYFFNEIQVKCPSAFVGMKNINKLTYMQHYGCPTRLTDITSNPLVALYFASLGNDDKDGIVYVFGVPEGDIHYEQSDRVQMLSKLAEFTPVEQKQIIIRAYIYLLKGKFPQSSNGKYVDSVIERFYHAVKRDNGAFEREIVPLDLLKPLFVQVNRDNPRILKQDGAFIMSGLDFNETDSDKKIDYYTADRIIIPADKKPEMRRQLEKVCINQASLFPEVDRVADYLKKV